MTHAPFSSADPRKQIPFSKISMPSPKEDSDKGVTVAKALEGFTLCAIIYSPMRNPLTKTIIGPDRDRPLGLLRFSSWANDSAPSGSRK